MDESRGYGGPMVNESDIRLAHRLADLADALALEFFGRRPAARHKEDGSPVSEADLAVEKAMLAVLAEERPGDAVLSEESGTLGAAARRRWILDPIDGTVPFLAGRRDWGTHVALEVEGELRVAVLSRPTEGVRWWAARGRGAFASARGGPLSASRPLRVPETAGPLSAARMGGFQMPDSPVEPVRGRMRWIDSSVCKKQKICWRAGPRGWSTRAGTSGTGRRPRCWWRRPAAVWTTCAAAPGWTGAGWCTRRRASRTG
ncbi:glucose-1-phosphate thymidylyltransferase [Streptomyces sp. C]|nr:glucose-1-phosphate thymidylyltransferase [Streptomyces sp. C]